MIYSAQGICRIDAICEKTLLGEVRSFYVLHPIDNEKLTISIPVDNKKVLMQRVMGKTEAEEMIASFAQPGADYPEKVNQRHQEYIKVLKNGQREQIAKVANTLLKRKHEAESAGKHFPAQDEKVLKHIQDTLFAELAIALDTTMDDVMDRIYRVIHVTAPISSMNDRNVFVT